MTEELKGELCSECGMTKSWPLRVVDVRPETIWPYFDAFIAEIEELWSVDGRKVAREVAIAALRCAAENLMLSVEASIVLDAEDDAQAIQAFLQDQPDDGAAA